MFAFQSCGPFTETLLFIGLVDEVGPFCTCSSTTWAEILVFTGFLLAYTENMTGEEEKLIRRGSLRIMHVQKNNPDLGEIVKDPSVLVIFHVTFPWLTRNNKIPL